MVVQIARYVSKKEDFTQSTEYAIRKDRATGRRGGGVALCYKKESMTVVRAKIPHSKHELLACIVRRKGQRRKIAIIVAYVPPWYNKHQNDSVLKTINDAILHVKNIYDDPYILLGGGFNRRDSRRASTDTPSIKPILTGPTKGNSVLDIMSSNFNNLLTDTGATSPISNDDNTSTNHLTVFAQFRMRVPSYEVTSYSYYHITEEGNEKFGKWLEDNSPIVNAEESATQMVSRLEKDFSNAMNVAYEYRTRKKR